MDNDPPDEVQDALDDKECMNTLYNELFAMFQSKTARLKKRVTHWMGKFAIVKAENNQLRKKERRMHKSFVALTESEQRSGIEIGQLTTKVDAMDIEIRKLKFKLQELETGTSV